MTIHFDMSNRFPLHFIRFVRPQLKLVLLIYSIFMNEYCRIIVIVVEFTKSKLYSQEYRRQITIGEPCSIMRFIAVVTCILSCMHDFLSRQNRAINPSVSWF